MPRSKLAPFYFQLSSLAHSPTNLPDLLNLCTSQEHLDQWQIATTDREALSSRVVLLLRDRIFRFQKWMNGSKAKASDWHQRHSFVLSSPFFFGIFLFTFHFFLFFSPSDLEIGTETREDMGLSIRKWLLEQLTAHTSGHRIWKRRKVVMLVGMFGLPI